MSDMRKHADAAGKSSVVKRPKPGLHPLARLQRLAGNRAVTAYVQRDCAPPVAPPGITAEADPKFAVVTKDVAGKAKAAAAHPTGESEAKKASEAAEPPSDDREAQAKAAHTDKMGGAKPGGFDKAAFIAAVGKAIRAQRPSTNEEAKSFASSGKAGQVKSQVSGLVSDGKNASAKDIAEKTSQAPDTAAAVDKPVTALPPAAAPPALDKPDPAKVIPGKAPAEQTELGGGKCEVDSKMAEAGVTEEQLAKSNEPEMTGAVTVTKQMESHAATAPAAVRSEEATQIATDKAGAGAAGAAGVAGLISERTTQKGHASLAQSEAKSKDEQERVRIAGEIKTIFDATKSKVDGILGGLDKKVGDEFEKGEQQARQAFERNHQRWMEEYEDRIGLAQWLIDKVLPTKKEVLDIFVRAADQYEKDMAVVISNVANTIETELNKATDAIKDGREQVKAKVAAQPAHLQKIAQQASADIGSKFDSLDSAVRSKQDALVEDLATRYNEARKGVDDRVKALQDEHKSWRDQAVDAVGGAIETIKQMKDMLMGVLARAAGAIELIIKDPIGFLGNLVNAVKTGIMAFKDNIVEHLKKGLKTWLLGNLAAGGLEVPSTFDLKGILKLILSILGLTWQAIRQRLLKFIPEKALKALETGLEVVKILVTEGPAGLWKWVQKKMGDFKEMILSEIKQMVSIEIIKAGVMWLLSMLNPASAFVKACKAIVDIVMFFVNNAAQIRDLVNAVLDSVESIARGGVGQAAALVEKSLSKALPVVIGFLAGMLGLGNIPGKIKGILAKVQEPIGKVIDGVVGTIAKAGKKLLGKLFKKKDKKKSDPEQIRQKAKQMLTPKTSTPFKTKAALDKVVSSVFKALKKDGLKSLTLKEKPDKKGAYQVIATASPPKPIDDAEVEEADEYKGDPSELTSWEVEVKSKESKMCYLSAESYEYNVKVLGELAGKSGSSKAGTALDRATDLLQKETTKKRKNSNAVYQAVVKACQPITNLYSPKLPIHVHHGGGGVKGNPAEHEQTRGTRKGSAINEKIKNEIAARASGAAKKPKKKGSLSSEEEALLNMPDGKRRKAITLYARQLIDKEVERAGGDDKGNYTGEDLRVAFEEAHLETHRRMKEAEERAKARDPNETGGIDGPSKWD